MMNKEILLEKINRVVEEVINKTVNRQFSDVTPINKNMSKFVTEGLVMTYNPFKVVRILNHKFNLKELGCQATYVDLTSKDIFASIRQVKQKENNTTRELDNSFNVLLTFENGFQNCSFDILQEMVHLMDTCGWYFSNVQDYHDRIFKTLSEKLYTQYQQEPSVLIFRAKHGNIQNNLMLPQYAYHICPTKIVERVLSQGLTSRNNGRTTNHPPRVYLYINGDTPSKWKEIAQRFYESSGIKEFTLLEIDMREIKETNKFHYDDLILSGMDAIYSFEPIPPKYIKPIDSISLETTEEDDLKSQNFRKEINNN